MVPESGEAEKETSHLASSPSILHKKGANRDAVAHSATQITEARISCVGHTHRLRGR